MERGIAMDIGRIDRNLAVATALEEKDIVFHSVRQEPFRIYGLYSPRTEPVFCRLPQTVAEATSPNVAALHTNTAGGRVRFSTDSPYVAIKTVMPSVCRFPHMPLCGTSGFDLYEERDTGSVYAGTFKPPVEMTDGYESILYRKDAGKRDFTINFPLYNDISELYIGVKEGAALAAAGEYRFQKPVLYYGSSITQGGCASRPGNSYEAILSRRFGCDYLNFGFSGSAKGEPALIEYLAGLEFGIFVCDYDHNAPTPDHLQNTHRQLYETIRAAKPEVPVILVSKPDFDPDSETDIERRGIVYATYQAAVWNGDKNIAFVDGASLFAGEGHDGCTVDGVHPNDLGFYRMADRIGLEVGQMLGV